MSERTGGIRRRADVEGRLVFVTGGASGIGLGLARAFAGEGGRIALADVRDDLLHAAVANLTDAGARVCAVELDVRDAAAWEGALDLAESQFGPLTVLCSNAGVAGSRLPLESTEPEALDWTFEVNVRGTFNAIRCGVPRLRQYNLPGHVLVTASMGAFLVRPGNGVYSASKAAIVAFAQALRAEFEGSALGVSVLCPGLVATQLLQSNFTLAPVGVALGAHEPGLLEKMRGALDPTDVGELVVRAVYEGRFWLFTHPELNPDLAEQFTEILNA